MRGSGIFLLAFWWASQAQANVVGPDAQNFNPTTSGLDFVTVQSSETLEPGIFNLGLFANYAVNTLPYFNNAPQGRGKINDTLLMSDINVGFGLLPGWEVGFSYPRLMKQTVESGGARGEFAATGNTELRLMTKVRLWDRDPYGAALVVSTNINRINNNPYVGRDAKPTWNAELVGMRRWQDFAIGINVGRRFKDPGEPLAGPILPSDDEWTASVGSSYLLTSLDSKLIVEVFGSRPATDASAGAVTRRQLSSLEALVGLKHFLTDQLALHAGGGTELIHGASSPDWRFYAGVNWTSDSGLRKEKVEVSINDKRTQVDDIPVHSGEIGINFGNIYFKSGSHSEILPGGLVNIERLAKYLQTPPPFKKLVIEGHTDSIGRDSYNLDLSRRRAQTVRQVLIDKYKIDGSKIEASGYGETRPIADNGNFQGRQKNRRVYFRVTR